MPLFRGPTSFTIAQLRQYAKILRDIARFLEDVIIPNLKTEE